MRIILAVIAMAVTGFIPYTGYADEFGDRFYSQAPNGLGDYTAEESEIPDIAMDDMAKDLQDIMPAAGDEDVSSAPEEIDAPE